MPKVRRKIKIKQRAKFVPKDSVLNDAIPKAKARPYPENAAHFKVKIKKK